MAVRAESYYFTPIHDPYQQYDFITDVEVTMTAEKHGTDSYLMCQQALIKQQQANIAADASRYTRWAQTDTHEYAKYKRWFLVSCMVTVSKQML
jgi:hypothetical protein